MLARFGLAAIVAALLALATNAAWADEIPPAKSGCGKCCEQNNCCKPPQQTSGNILKVNRDAVYFGFGAGLAAARCKDKCGGCCTAKTIAIKKIAPPAPMVIFMPCPVNPAAMCPMMRIMSAPVSPPVPPLPIMAGAPPMMPPHSMPMPMMPPMGYSVGQMNDPCPCPTKVESCSPILSVVADVCQACSPTPSLPSMCLAALGYLADVCNQRCCTSMAYPTSNPSAQPAQTTEVLPAPVPDNTVCNPVYVSQCVRAISAETSPLIRVSCEKDGNQLEWNLGDAHMSCKKMTVDRGDRAMTMYAAQGKICIRAAEMKARADSILTDRKDRIILQGDALLHYCKGDQRIHMNAERIELNLRTGAVTIQP